MHLALLGVSHHTAPVDLRERVDFCRRGVVDAVAALVTRPGVSEGVVLSTCNRAELYVASEDVAEAHRALAAFMSAYHGLSTETLAPHLYAVADADAARHLFRVAAGLDSLVVGEPQILGQVKEAYTVATEQRSTGPVLNKLFHSAFGAGKRVRSETGLGEGAVSVSYAAVSLARKIFGELRDLSVLVVGAGEMAELTAVHLQAQQVRRIAVTGRTAAHAEALAAKVGGASIPWADMIPALAASDIVVTATGAPIPIIAAAQIEAAMRTRRNRALFLIDIAVPRDVDSEAGRTEQVFLYTIDDLRAIVNENLARRATEIQRAEAIVAEEVETFMAWLRSRGAIPTVVALRQRFETIRQAELRRLESKLAALPPPARARVDEITRLIVEKLLLTPTEQLKAVSDQETVASYADALNRLFSLSDERGAGEAATSDAETDTAAPPSKSTVRS